MLNSTNSDTSGYTCRADVNSGKRVVVVGMAVVVAVVVLTTVANTKITF